MLLIADFADISLGRRSSRRMYTADTETKSSESNNILGSSHLFIFLFI